MEHTHTLTYGFTYRNRPSRIWTSIAFEYGSGTPGGHGAGGHEHEEGTALHEHAPLAGGCSSRCPAHFTQNLSIGWDVLSIGDQPRAALQFNIENLTNNVYLISRESTFVQGQYAMPRQFSGSLRIGF
jgi:hypothetical protein